MKPICVLTLVALLAAAPITHAEGPLNGGDANCDGVNSVTDLTLMINYLFRGGAAPCAVSPLGGAIAGGCVLSSGTVTATTGNFSCTWNDAFERYEIEISGYSYLYSDFVSMVTPFSSSAICHTSSVSGRLLVYFQDLSGAGIPAGFHFAVYKPMVVRSSASPIAPLNDAATDD